MNTLHARLLAGSAALMTAAAGCVSAQTSGSPSADSSADSSVDPSDENRRCLALSMYWEARSEGPEGMRAVGAVVLNRVESGDFPGTPCEVVYQGGETAPCQFSWWCDGRSDTPRDAEQWEIALTLAADMLEDRGEDPTNGALFFHSADIAVPWRIERARTARILGHVYYR